MKELMKKIMEKYESENVYMRVFPDGQIDILEVDSKALFGYNTLDCFDSLIELKREVNFNKNL
jgi:hypothetical protein